MMGASFQPWQIDKTLRAVERGLKSPLDAAVTLRDNDVLHMVSQALELDTVALALQPVVRSDDTGTVVFYEGLIRIFDETGRIIPARDFIRQVEAHELGRRLDAAALDHAFRLMQANPDLRVSINMSARSIGYFPWLEKLERGLSRAPDMADRLILELSESSILMLPDIIGPFIADMQKRHIAVALDNFGATHCALSIFRNHRFDVVKIAAPLCRGIHSSFEKQAVVSAIQTISKHFKLLMVAEGVEAPSDAAWLSKSGIHCQQGYFYAAPKFHKSDLPVRKLRR